MSNKPYTEKNRQTGPLLVVGAGSFSTEVEELARLLGYEDVAFLDDDPFAAYSRPVIGTTAEIEKWRAYYPAAITALGNNEHRIRYHGLLLSCGYHVPALIHPTAYVSADAVVAPGCIIREKAVVSRYAKLGEACILNVGALVDHHVELGYGCHILMGAVIRNQAKVAPLTRVESLCVVQ